MTTTEERPYSTIDHINSLTGTLQEIFDRLSRTTSRPWMRYRISEAGETLDYVWATDLMPGTVLSGDPRDNALDVLRTLFAAQNGERAFQIDSLYVKHTLTSQMGTHCIIEGRQGNTEELEKFFVVHFNRRGRPIFLTCVYNPGYRPASQDVAARDETSAIVNDIQSGRIRVDQNSLVYEKTTRPGQVTAERMIIPNHAERADELVTRVKFTDGRQNYVFHVSQSEKGISPVNFYRVDSGALISTGYVYAAIWNEEASENDLKTVVLRDIGSVREMRGPYVAVFDYVSPSHDLGDLQGKFGVASTVADRLMAYYHVDLVQRFFRDLGLDMLDEYDALKPLRVELMRNTETKYLPIDAKIQFRTIGGGASIACTDARDPRLIYHEFVHAVTDSLARLRRQDTAQTKDHRFRNVVQAHAMDEGFADYFACSLAVRQGATEPVIVPKLEVTPDSPKRIKRDVNSLEARWLVGSNPNLTVIDEKILTKIRKIDGVDIEEVDDKVLYSWGNQWARFLWKFREKVGEDIADRVIANSLLFLHRWASFELGVLAMIIADALLFDGEHEKEILNAGGSQVQNWSTKPDMAGMDFSIAA